MSNELWNQLAAKGGRALDAGQHQQLERYLDLLAEANTRMNLTRIVDREQAAIAHVGDALTLLPYIPAGPLRIADIGSGGGVPGIPLAVACPECQFTLMESTQKKATFLQQCAASLELANVTVLPLRAEQVGAGGVARAV